MARWLSTRDLSRRPEPIRLRSVIAAQYTLIVSSLLEIALTVYLVLLGPRDYTATCANVLMLVTAGLTLLYPLAIQTMRRKEQRLPDHQRKKPKLRLPMQMFLVLISTTWVAASILSIIETTRSWFCEETPTNRLGWQGMASCRVQKAAIATAILSMVIAIVLLRLARNTSFAAFLTGISNWDHHEEELRLSNNFSWAPTVIPGEKTSIRPSYDSLSTYVSPSPLGPAYNPSRGLYKSWLPPLKFQEPSEEVHPALKLDCQTPTQSTSTVDLLPSPITGLPFTPNRPNSGGIQSTLKRSRTLATTSSSVYSRSTSASSAFSRRPSTLSSFSNSSGGSAPKSVPPRTLYSAGKPNVPSIPLKFRQPNHMLREGGRPIRPGSTPTMPPSAFWLYARNIQQHCNALMDEETPNQTHNMQSQTLSRSSRQPETSVCRYPSIHSSPGKAMPLRPSTNKHNTMRIVKHGSYERLRKGKLGERPPTWAGKADLDRRLAAAVDARDVAFGREPGGRRRSRTLVKKRQPWDSKPRVN